MSFDFNEALGAVVAGTMTADDAAERLLGQLADEELLWLLDGDVSRFGIMKLPQQIKQGAIPAGAIARLGMPGIRFSDGPRGVVMGASTSFPVTMARAATWDPELEAELGLAMGREARAQGANYSGAVCVNLLRHPAWGRAQECYGEDPVLVGRMGAGLTRGLRRNVMACVKHFALNSMENARFTVDVQVDEHALHEVYLPHFKSAIDAGADSVMSAYNSVNGAWCDMNAPLLNDILRDEWQFTGFVTSDWVYGTHDAVKSLEAGLDIEMPARLLRARELPGALRSGRISRELLLRSGRRILSTQLRHAAQRDEAQPDLAVVACAEHRALAHKVAVQAAVLLKNDPVAGAPLLPLPAGHRVAVIGPLADAANLGDRGSSLVHVPSSVSILEGLREVLPQGDILHDEGSDPDVAGSLAAGADTAIVIVGMTAEDEGESIVNDNVEGAAVMGAPFSWRPVQWLMKKLTSRALGQFGRGGDRRTLSLKPDDEALIAAVVAANPRTVVILIGGSAILTETWRGSVPAILMAWYPGMEGGRALADVLTGAQEPGGRLPFTIPTDPSHLPFFDADAKRITYDAWWGQRMLDRDGHEAAFRFGHGLGYTSHAVDLASATVDGMKGTATVRVANTGPRDGAAVAQLYAFDADLAQPIPQLVGFRRVELAINGTRDVPVNLDLTPLFERSPDTKQWSPRSGNWHLVAATASPGRTAIANSRGNASAIALSV